MQTDNVINDFPTKDNGPVAYLLFLIFVFQKRLCSEINFPSSKVLPSISLRKLFLEGGDAGFKYCALLVSRESRRFDISPIFFVE
jgi:hypothetical protein